MTQMNNHEVEAKQLFDDVVSYVEKFCNPAAKPEPPYMPQKNFEEYSLRKRIKKLQRKMDGSAPNNLILNDLNKHLNFAKIRKQLQPYS